jgi:hypothetical protein
VEIRYFAGILQAPETSSKVSYFFDAEEASGSNPLSPTSESLSDTLKTTSKGKPPERAGGFTTPVLHQRYAGLLGDFGIPHLWFSYGIYVERPLRGTRMGRTNKPRSGKDGENRPGFLRWIVPGG